MLGQFFGAKIVNVYKYPSELSHIAFYDYFFCICFGFSRVDNLFAAAAAESLQLCPTPCDPIDGSPPGSPVPGILQARTLEWVAIAFSNA